MSVQVSHNHLGPLQRKQQNLNYYDLLTCSGVPFLADSPVFWLLLFVF